MVYKTYIYKEDYYKRKKVSKWLKIKKKMHGKVSRNQIRMRNNPTEAEMMLYGKLDLLGYGYVRQKIFGYRIVDAYIPSLKVAIEANGAQHYALGGSKSDEERESKIRQMIPEILFLYYSNYEILYNTDFINRLKSDLERCKAEQKKYEYI